MAGYAGGFIGGLISGGLGITKKAADSLFLLTLISAISSAASSVVTDSINNVFLPENEKLSAKDIIINAGISALIGAFVGFGVNAVSIGLSNPVASSLMRGLTDRFANILTLSINALLSPDYIVSKIVGEYVAQ